MCGASSLLLLLPVKIIFCLQQRFVSCEAEEVFSNTVKFLRELSPAHHGEAQPCRCPWLGLGVLRLMLGLEGVTLHLPHLPLHRDHVMCKGQSFDQQMRKS